MVDIDERMESDDIWDSLFSTQIYDCDLLIIVRDVPMLEISFGWDISRTWIVILRHVHFMQIYCNKFA